MVNRNKAALSIITALILTLYGSSAGAEVIPGTLSITPLFGIYTFDSEQRIDDGTLLGLRLGYDIDKHWGGEISLGYVDSDFDFVDVGVDGYLYHAEGLYHFRPDERFVPFVAAGVGGIDLQFEGAGNSSGVLFDYGAGAKLFVSENTAVRADIRHIIAYSDALNNFAFTLGVTYRFGKAKERARDSDRDGISDPADLCPGTPPGAPVDAKGCPEDSDGDGVFDYLDKCMETPSGVAVDTDGCPPDGDNDSVADYLDICPDTPAGKEVDERGCSPTQRKKVSMILNVEFDSNSTRVKEIYYPLLERAAEFMKKYPFTVAVIEGHTDSRGSEEHNLSISKKRADSVKSFLIEKYGINQARIKAIGFGESKPIADNKTKAGRERNRRVLLIINPPPSE